MTAAELDELIEQATVDCYNESEQVSGLFTMIEEYLSLSFQTTVLGMPVTVARVDVTADDRIVAICARDGHRQTIPILDLALPDLAPDGWEWVEGTAAGHVDLVISTDAITYVYTFVLPFSACLATRMKCWPHAKHARNCPHCSSGSAKPALTPSRS